MRKSPATFLMGLGLVLGHNTMTLAAAPEIWFSPGDDLEVRGIVGHPDYPKLFEEPLSWPIGLAHINVLQTRAPYIARKPTESAQFFNFVKSHHILLAAVMQVMPSDTCGQGTEGIMSHKGIDFYPRAIKKAGVQLDYVLMDEPLYFGHDYSEKSNACRLPIRAVAEGVAESVKTIRSYYPNVKFVLSEPEQGLPGGPQELAEFLDIYKSVLNEYPVSVRFDVQWRKDWRRDLPPFISVLHARNIGYGVIFNAAGAPKDDRMWIQSAKENVQAWRGAIHVQPDHVMIQTWNPNPVRNVPESDPSTMTGFLKWYVQQNGG